MRRAPWLVSLALTAAACAQTPPAGRSPAPPAQEEFVRRAMEDAAQRLGVAKAALTAVSVEPVTWRDGSLGCPEPDLMYPQVLVPGFRILLASAVGQLDYHTSLRGQLVLCPAGRAVQPLPKPPT
jgi:hypothetical protein